MSNVNNRLTGENLSNLVALLKRNRLHSLSHCLPLHSLEKGNKYKLSSILTLLPRPGANPMFATFCTTTEFLALSEDFFVGKGTKTLHKQLLVVL
jgi:hypothetical protein